MEKNFNITKPRFSKHVWPVHWAFVKSRFHCNCYHITWKSAASKWAGPLLSNHFTQAMQHLSISSILNISQCKLDWLEGDIDPKTNFHRVSFTIFFKFEGTKEILSFVIFHHETFKMHGEKALGIWSYLPGSMLNFVAFKSHVLHLPSQN